ncbi:MAG: 2-C-methyl-D-erythritol 2,4-cyclodiphosphate synthase [Chitinophagaceae bacterium]
MGAIGAGDIGLHFPDTDMQYKNIDSKLLLQKSYAILQEKGYDIVNIDTNICLQAPKIKPYVMSMRETIAKIVEISIDDVSIKATTTEQLGFVGREEGIVAYATVLIKKKD